MKGSPDVLTLEKTSYGGVPEAVVACIPGRSRRVLDLGCAAGELGEALKRREPHVEVTGVEMSPVLAASAATRLDRVITGTIEDVMGELPDGYFDCVVFADVLEHLVDPYEVLSLVRHKLDPERGVVVASIPNVRHYKVARMLLLDGDWQYSERGLLDSGHLRFFTLKSTRRMFEWAGYDTAVCRVNCDAPKYLWRLNRLLGGRLLPFMVYQYILTARPRQKTAVSTKPWWSDAPEL